MQDFLHQDHGIPHRMVTIPEAVHYVGHLIEEYGFHGGFKEILRIKKWAQAPDKFDVSMFCLHFENVNDSTAVYDDDS